MTKFLLATVLALAFIGAFADDIFLGEDHEPGIIQVTAAGDDLFYWLFRSRTDKDNDPLVFWLTGGPGCSSIVALFGENGPFKINNDTTLRINPWSWNNDSNIVFVDQPRGTGFSQAKSFVTSEDQIAEDFYGFLNIFYQKHPEYNGRATFITGESYAGHYVPAIAAYVLKQKNPHINLVGVAIGNGLVDPYNQYPAYADFSYENKLISTPTYYFVKGALGLCQMLIKTGIWPIALYECQLSLIPIIGLPIWPAFNVYDIREKCEKPPLCYDFSLVDKFLAREDVRKILGVGNRQWQDCNMDVHTALLADWMLTLAPKIEEILAAKVFTLVYSGDKDFICNWRGGEAWTNLVPWEKHDQYSKLNYTEWIVNNQSLGQYKSIDPLTFLRVYNAGHMVPMDQPEASLGMLVKFFKRWAYIKAHGHPPAETA